MLVSKFCQRSWQVVSQVNQFNCKTWQWYQGLLFSLAIYKPVLAFGAFGCPLTSSLFWSQIHYEVTILSSKPFQTLWQAFSIVTLIYPTQKKQKCYDLFCDIHILFMCNLIPFSKNTSYNKYISS